MKTRTGKIARLPKSIRDELNHRLDNGADGPELLSWLNSLPEVQCVLAEKFGGKPVTKHNLSDWRRGGYFEWSATRDGRAQWQELLAHAHLLRQKRTDNDGEDVASYFGDFLLAELGLTLDQLHRIEDPGKRWKTLQAVSRVFSRLQNNLSREKQIRLREVREQTRSQQIEPSRPESPSKNFFLQSKGREALPPTVTNPHF